MDLLRKEAAEVSPGEVLEVLGDVSVLERGGDDRKTETVDCCSGQRDLLREDRDEWEDCVVESGRYSSKFEILDQEQDIFYLEIGDEETELDLDMSIVQFPIPKAELRARLVVMLEKERTYDDVRSNYIECVQVDGMREVWRARLFEWLLEFVDEFGISITTVTAAMNYVDRYLSRVSTKKCILQLVALAAVCITSKLFESRPIGIDELQSLAEGIYLESDIRLMELELLRVLSWRLHPVSPYSFLRHLILYFDSVDIALRKKVLSFAEAFLEIVLCEYQFVRFLPSEAATASLLCAFDMCDLQSLSLVERSFWSGGIVDKERVKLCKTLLLRFVREIFPEYFRAGEVVSPDCVADLVLSSPSSTDVSQKKYIEGDHGPMRVSDLEFQ